MPAAIDLEPFREEICYRYRLGDSGASIASWLGHQHNVQISSHSVNQRLRAWGMTRTRIKHNDNIDPELRIIILEEFYTHNTSEKQLLRLLQGCGYPDLGARTLQRIRLQLGLKRRVSCEEWDTQKAEFESQLFEELQANPDANRGYRKLQVYLSQRHMSVSQHRLRLAMKALDPTWPTQRQRLDR